MAGDGGAVIWPQLIGFARAKELLMTGELLPASEAARMGLINYAVPADPKHAHVVFETDHGRRITFFDPRRFGFMDLIPTEAVERHPWFAKMGPEPLDSAFDGEVLAKAFKGRKQNPKTLLLDQRVVAGLGNIYVCEALNRAHISPIKPAGGGRLTVRSLDLGEERSWAIQALSSAKPQRDWSDYVGGVAVELQRQGVPIPSAVIEIRSTVPIGAGLSSSASLEIAVGLALATVAGSPLGRRELARRLHHLAACRMPCGRGRMSSTPARKTAPSSISGVAPFRIAWPASSHAVSREASRIRAASSATSPSGVRFSAREPRGEHSTPAIASPSLTSASRRSGSTSPMRT